MNKRILHHFRKFFALTFTLLAFGKMNAQTVDILTNLNTNGSQNIFTGNSGYHVGEVIYQDVEIGSTNFTTLATAINRIEVNNFTVPTPTGFGNFSVLMKEVPSTTTTFTAGIYDTSGYTLVYSGSLNITDTGWKGINLTTPFVRTAGNNLQIMFRRLDGVVRTAPVTYLASTGNTTSPSITTTRRINATTAPIAGTTSLAQASAFRPAIRIAHTNPTDASLVGLTVPNSTCSTGPYSVTITLKNTGTTTTITPGAAVVTLFVNGANTLVIPQPNATSLAPGASETLTFSSVNLPNTGYNVIGGLVTYVGDGNSGNDTIRSTLSNTPTTTVFPITEDVEVLPPNYFGYLKLISGASAWGLQTGKRKNGNLSDSLAPHGGNNYYVFNSYEIQNSDEALYSNCLSLPASGSASDIYNVSFWMSADTSYSGPPLGTFLDSIYVVVTTNGGATWTRLAGFQRNDPTALLPTWKQHTVNLNAYAGQTISIGFEGVSKWGNIIGLDDITITAQSSLPVKLVTFNGERNGSSNRIFWTTATETNNKGFELQRSTDGVNFTSLSFIESKADGGNSSRSLNYDFVDTKPFAASNYYRLKQVDKDGKFEYSKVILIKGKASSLSISSVYPNPAINNLKVMIAAPSSEKATIIVTDLAGKVVLQNTLQMVVGDNNFDLNVKSLAKGTYAIKMVCTNGCNSNVVRFVKQ